MRRNFKILLGLAAIAATAAGIGQVASGAKAPQRPNILWITNEDMSPHLGSYGDPQARTPNLDRLAAQGARFTRAFSISGVCAPSRSAIITGMYPSSIGTHHMRCRGQLPEGLELEVEQQLRVIPNHICAATNMHDRVWGIRRDEVVEEWEVAARGRIR